MIDTEYFWADSRHDTLEEKGIAIESYTKSKAKDFKDDALGCLEDTLRSLMETDSLDESRFFSHFPEDEYGQLLFNEVLYSLGKGQRMAIMAIIQEACKKIKDLSLNDESALDDWADKYQEDFFARLEMGDSI